MCVCVCVCVCMYTCMLSHFSCIRLFVTLWSPTFCDCSPQAPLSMGFSRQEYWSGLPCLYIYIYTYSKKRIVHRLHFESALVSLSLMLDLLISFKWY